MFSDCTGSMAVKQRWPPSRPLQSATTGEVKSAETPLLFTLLPHEVIIFGHNRNC